MTKKALGRGLPGHIKEREMKSEFEKILGAWKAEGYNVTRLEGILDLDIDSMSQAFTLFDNDVRNLRDISEIVEMMDAQGFESEIDSIRSKLKNPDLTTEVLQEVYELDNKIKDIKDSQYTEKHQKKVGEWSKELDQGKDELMDLWEKSEQEAVVKDPSVLEETPEIQEKKSDSDLEDRLSTIKQRLNKLSLGKSVPLRSDKMDLEQEQEAGTGEQHESEPQTEEQPAVPDTVNREEASNDTETAPPEEQPDSTPDTTEPEPPSIPEEPSPEIQSEPPASQEETESSAPPQTTPSESAGTPEPPEKKTDLTPEQTSELNEALQIAKEMYRKGEYDKSIEYFNMALEIDTFNSDAIFFKKRAESKIN
jgi:pilus assembly protein FimV